MSKPDDRTELVRRVVEVSRIPRSQLAEDANVSRAALDSWTAGRRTPNNYSLQRLSAGLRHRIQVLAELAAELERAATNNG